MSLVSLTIGGSAFHSLLAKKVKDRCIHSKLNGGSFNLVLIPRKYLLPPFEEEIALIIIIIISVIFSSTGNHIVAVRTGNE